MSDMGLIRRLELCIYISITVKQDHQFGDHYGHKRTGIDGFYFCLNSKH